MSKHWKAILTIIVGGTFIVLGAAHSFKVTKSAITGTSRGLSCDNAEFDFGDVDFKAADSLEHDFVVSNRSGRPIQILRAAPACGCTSATIPNEPIPSGGRVAIPVVINWSGRAGHQETSVALFTDAERLPPILLTTHGNVRVPVAISPDVIDFGTLRPGESADRTVSFVSADASVNPMVASVTGLGNELRMARRDGNRATIAGPAGTFLLSIRAPRAGGSMNTNVTFNTNLAFPSQLTLHVSAVFEPAIAAEPKSVVFVGDEASKTVQLHSNDANLSLDRATYEIVAEAESMNQPFTLVSSRTAARADGEFAELVIRHSGTGDHPLETTEHAVLVIKAGVDEARVNLMRIRAFH